MIVATFTIRVDMLYRLTHCFLPFFVVLTFLHHCEHTLPQRRPSVKSFFRFFRALLLPFSIQHREYTTFRRRFKNFFQKSFTPPPRTHSKFS
jgi:hypothetical protein